MDDPWIIRYKKEYIADLPIEMGKKMLAILGATSQPNETPELSAEMKALLRVLAPYFFDAENHEHSVS